MSTYPPAESVDIADLMEIHQIYGRQSQLIDEGHAEDWASTFTADGEFRSPSYPAPVVGTAALTRFAREFTDGAAVTGERRRHVVTNLAVQAPTADELVVRAYLQIVATQTTGQTRILRFTTITDQVVREKGSWRIACRTVRRDDQSS